MKNKIFSFVFAFLIVFCCSVDCFAIETENIELINEVLYVGVPDGVSIKNDDENCVSIIIHDGGVVRVSSLAALFARIFDGWDCHFVFGGYTSVDEINVVKIDEFFEYLEGSSDYIFVEQLVLSLKTLSYTVFDLDNISSVSRGDRVEYRFGFSAEGVEQLKLLKRYFDDYFSNVGEYRYDIDSLEPFNPIYGESAFDGNPNSYSMVVINDVKSFYGGYLTKDSFYAQKYYDYLSTPEDTFDLMEDIIDLLDVSKLVLWMPPVVASVYISQFALFFSVILGVWLLKLF